MIIGCTQVETTCTDPHIILSVYNALFLSLITSVLTFMGLAFVTYVPQATILSLFTGPFLGPTLALFLVGAESIFLLKIGRAHV